MIKCNWISRFSAENERLFVGYQRMYPLRIVSIRIIESNKSYQRILHAVWMLDLILSGHDIRSIKRGQITSEDVSILQTLIGIKLGEIELEAIKDVDTYIMNCFDLCLSNKKEYCFMDGTN